MLTIEQQLTSKKTASSAPLSRPSLNPLFNCSGLDLDLLYLPELDKKRSDAGRTTAAAFGHADFGSSRRSRRQRRRRQRLSTSAPSSARRSFFFLAARRAARAPCCWPPGPQEELHAAHGLPLHPRKRVLRAAGVLRVRVLKKKVFHLFLSFSFLLLFLSSLSLSSHRHLSKPPLPNTPASKPTSCSTSPGRWERAPPRPPSR